MGSTTHFFEKILFFLIGCIPPILFSHLLWFLDIAFIPVGFEYWKRSSILILGILSVFFLYTSNPPFKERNFFFALGIFAFLFTSKYLLGASFTELLWYDESFGYGFFFLFLCGILYFWNKLLTTDQSRIVGYGIACSSIWILSYAFLQYFGLDYVQYETSFDANRIYSTLGNPAHLALFFLLLLPFIFSKWGFYFCIPFIIVIFLTKTYIAICILFLWFIWKAPIHQKWKNSFLMVLFSLFLALFFLSERHISGLIRWELWKEGISLLFSSWEYFLFGLNPNDLSYHYNSGFLEVKKLIEENTAIGHIHSLWGEFALRFGMPAFLLLLFGFFQIYRSQELQHNTLRKEVFFIFCIFSSWHIPEILHWFLLFYFLGPISDTKKTSAP